MVNIFKAARSRAEGAINSFEYAWPALYKTTKIAAQTLLTLQASAILGVVGIDEFRKLRTAPVTSNYPEIRPHPFKAAGSEFTLYMSGKQVYPDMIAAIENARETVYFETFIWKGDEVGRRFKNALIRAAQRGVEVYIIWDRFGNMVVNPRFFKFPKLRNLHVLKYSLWHTGRDHRKILAVDDDLAFVGGFNIGDTYRSRTWRDTHVRLRGTKAWELHNAFVDFWNNAKHRRQPNLPDPGAANWDARIAARLNDPKRLLFPVRGMYLDALNRASESVYITSAYFIPDRNIEAALIAAARRGADVKVLVPEKSNHIVADWISRAYLTELLEAGIELWLYQDVMIHSKTAVIDGKWATIGTANIDRLSMTGNFEINLEITDEDMAQRMQQMFLTDLTNSRQMTLTQWRKRPLLSQATEMLLKPFGLLI
ncbi:MAG: phospholipase D-like domain-containing protein [Varibaculum sp.]|nr:phospholipase D-like domain-containing protein [Varibaculum sp.]